MQFLLVLIKVDIKNILTHCMVLVNSNYSNIALNMKCSRAFNIYREVDSGFTLKLGSVCEENTIPHNSLYAHGLLRLR